MQPILHDLPDRLEGERIVLRPFRVGDGEALWEAVEESREHIEPWMEWVRHNVSLADSEEYARRALARWITREVLQFGIWDKDGERYLGQCGLVRPDWEIPSFEIGYWVRASAEGHGFVSEAARLVVALAFDRLGAQRLHIHCDSLNRRSAAVARRLGFLHEATLRNNERNTRGELRDTLIFGMTSGDYTAVKSPRLSSGLAD